VSELRIHGGRHYTIVTNYSLPDDAWFIELSETVPAQDPGTAGPDTPRHVVDDVRVWAVVPDEDPTIEPTIRFLSSDKHVIPYEIMRWFMDTVSEDVAACRAAMAAGITADESPTI
jgi:hypothetical protein